MFEVSNSDAEEVHSAVNFFLSLGLQQILELLCALALQCHVFQLGPLGVALAFKNEPQLRFGATDFLEDLVNLVYLSAELLRGHLQLLVQPLEDAHFVALSCHFSNFVPHDHIHYLEVELLLEQVLVILHQVHIFGQVDLVSLGHQLLSQVLYCVEGSLSEQGAHLVHRIGHRHHLLDHLHLNGDTIHFELLDTCLVFRQSRSV